MNHRISASKLISAPATSVYSILADYRNGHPLILPKPPFVSMSVTSGGVGAGTEIELTMRIMGRYETYLGVVSEPIPGRVITEHYLGKNTRTTFNVEPCNAGRSANVTIATDIEVRAGLPGAAERWLATCLLRPVYLKELEQLADLAETSVAWGTA